MLLCVHENLQEENENLRKPLDPKAYRRFKKRTINCGDVIGQRGLELGAVNCGTVTKTYEEN